MTVATKVVLSGASDGQQIKVAATSTAGTLIHTTGATAIDEIWLWAHNTHTVARVITIEWDGVTDPDDIMSISIPINDGWTLIVPGFLSTGTGVIRCFAETANIVLIQGYVNRLT